MKQERENLNFQSQNNEKYNLPFKLSELKNSFDKSKDTTAGPDDIHYQILKHLPSDALETLLNIMNEIWRTGKFPEDWHKAVIIPIPKPGKDKTTNYRPTALTICICKTMERMITDWLVWFLESNNLISGNQAGFGKNYSTNDPLVRLESFIRDAFIKGMCLLFRMYQDFAYLFSKLPESTFLQGTKSVSVKSTDLKVLV